MVLRKPYTRSKGLLDCWGSQLSSCRKHFFYEVKAKLYGFFFFFLDSSTWQVKVREGKNSVLIGRKPKPAGKDYMTESGSKQETVSCCGGIWTAPAGWRSCQGLMAAASSCGASKDEVFFESCKSWRNCCAMRAQGRHVSSLERLRRR